VTERIRRIGRSRQPGAIPRPLTGTLTSIIIVSSPRRHHPPVTGGSTFTAMFTFTAAFTAAFSAGSQW
jgi:hypothetical protein